MTLIESATSDSAVSQDLMSSAVTHAGRFPRKTVLLILSSVFYSVGIVSGTRLKAQPMEAISA